MRIVWCIAILLMLAGCTKEAWQQKLWAECQSKDSYSVLANACEELLTNPDLPRKTRGEVYSSLCVLYTNSGEWRKALDACKKANDPLTFWSHYNNLGVAYFMLEDYRQALWAFTEAIDARGTSFPEGHYNRALAYEKLHNRSAAAADFKLAAKGCGTYITIARHHYKLLIRFKKL